MTALAVRIGIVERETPLLSPVLAELGVHTAGRATINPWKLQQPYLTSLV